MTPPELRQKAARYRAIAYTIPPHLPGPQNREYYLKMADDLERQADEIDNPQSGDNGTSKHKKGIDDTPQGHADDTPQGDGGQGAGRGQADDLRKLEIYGQARLYPKLAQAVINDKRPNIHRAFCVWATLDRGKQTVFPMADLLDYFSQVTDNHPRNVRRWFDAGEGVFWDIASKQGGTYVYFYGRYKVLRNYKIELPGVTQLVESDRLLGQLKTARAALFSLWIERENKWASRATIRQITGAAERTQLNYDNINQQHKQPTYVLGYNLETSSSLARQMPNRYYRQNFTLTKATGKRYNLYMPETNGVSDTPQGGATGVTLGKKRLLYDNPTAAVKAAQNRANKGITGQVFSVLPQSSGSSLILKVYDHAMA